MAKTDCTVFRIRTVEVFRSGPRASRVRNSLGSPSRHAGRPALVVALLPMTPRVLLPLHGSAHPSEHLPVRRAVRVQVLARLWALRVPVRLNRPSPAPSSSLGPDRKAVPTVMSQAVAVQPFTVMVGSVSTAVLVVALAWPRQVPVVRLRVVVPRLWPMVLAPCHHRAPLLCRTAVPSLTQPFAIPVVVVGPHVAPLWVQIDVHLPFVLVLWRHPLFLLEVLPVPGLLSLPCLYCF